METWSLNHVLGLSLSVLLLALPRPLGAQTPSNSSSDPAGFYRSGATYGLSSADNNATTSLLSSESLSPSQRNVLLTHAAVTNYDSDRTQTFTETSSRSLETSSLSTEPLTSTIVVATTESSSSISESSSSSISESSSSSISERSSSSISESSSSSISESSSSSISESSSSSISESSSSISESSSSSISEGSSISESSSSSIISESRSSTSESSSSSGKSSSINESSSSISESSSSSSTSESSSISSSSKSSSISESSSINSMIKSNSISSRSSSSQNWKDFVITDQTPDITHAVSWKTRGQTEDSSQAQDNPGSTLWQRDTTALSSQTVIHTDSIYTSTTISRAGERTLLSVTSSASGNSTSSAFTDDSNFHQPPSTWAIPAGSTQTEDHTHPSPRSDSRDTTDHHMTHSFKGMFSESGTQSLTEPPNATHQQQTSASEETSKSTPPLRVRELSTDQSDMSFSSPSPVTSPSGALTATSGTDLESDSYIVTSPESSTADHSPSTQKQEGTEGHPFQSSEDSMDLGLTTATPTVSINTSEMDNSVTGPSTLATEIFLYTTPVPVTDRPQVTEVETFKATASSSITTTSTYPASATSSSSFSSTTNSSPPELRTEATTSSTATSTPANLQTSAVHPTLPVSPVQTMGSTTGIANPIYPTTLEIETGTLGSTASHSQQIVTTYTHSTPSRSTEVPHTTGKQTDRATTEQAVTSSSTLTQTTKPPPHTRNPCVSNPCMNGGMCVSYKRHQYMCHCQQAWTGPTCNQDVDECERDPCPLGSRCVNTRGSFSCECPLGFDLEDGRLCTRAKTFLGTFSVNRQPHDPIIFKSATLHEIQREIILLLNTSLSVLQGYSRSTLSKKEEDGVRISAINMFSISTDVTSTEVYNSIQMSLSNCTSSTTHCRMVLHHQLTYHVESLCVAQKTQCDAERSTCTDNSGTAYCQCFQGYYKHNPDDLSCLECGDGYKLENGTCVPCMFGFGGFNCGNFYKLIAVVVSPAGGALLLILIIALTVTCCKKDKNDINKIIFKSGDLQMSPYADFPKNNRISTEWGRETIEMQENGSTKNLLQMTDIYYSPALRNSDLERNGLYPFPGLPGSRHSCIYPAQWNPSFISDDSRRRDYF